ncbi:hypothetical protein ASN88_00617 [Streptococcus parauberis]|uniref:hypothetical protein n=1 Tax=Streptococcus parauberis TaxID=1348 RepID=UPI000CCE6E06|nr:hypothetical protein [Streptococcus parauberis]PNY22280.1 hypothetical protein ASN88_00617 [Streptococcus parauberis]
MKNIKKKDIAILCQYFYPEKITSAKLPFMTAEKLVKDNFTVDVICGTPSKYIGQNVLVPKIEEKNGIFIKRLPYLKFKSKKSIFRIINFISLVLSFSFRYLI